MIFEKLLFFVVYCKSMHPTMKACGVWGLDFLGLKKKIGFNLVF